jgi:acetoin utilization deacetylase AcuC-like enzyme
MEKAVAVIRATAFFLRNRTVPQPDRPDEREPMPDGTTAVHIDQTYENHVMPAGHPERTDRIRCLLDHRALLDKTGVRLLKTGRCARREDVLRVHEPGLVDRLVATAGRGHVMLDADTHTSERSWQTALVAAGGVLDTTDAVMSGVVTNGFALVRPPGHHAEPDRAMGFCLINNVAIAARYLQDVYGLDRILVVDWDVHHGNGTQRAFYEENGVLFVSIHQYPCYPGTGSMVETGLGEGDGYNVNIPLGPGCGDAEYAAVFDRIIRSVAAAYKPEFVLVSAGFDAHRDDPLSGMNVTRAGFRHMASTVAAIAGALAGGRLVAVLEGGYNLEALVSSVDAVTDVLAGIANTSQQPPGGFEPLSGSDAEQLCEPVLRIQSRFWSLK